MDFGSIQRITQQVLLLVPMFVQKEVKLDYLLIIQHIQLEDMALGYFMK